MIGIICAAGGGTRARESQEKYGVSSKSLLPINKSGKTVLDMAVEELAARCDGVMIVGNEQNKKDIDARFASYPTVWVVDQADFPANHTGTSRAVMAGLEAAWEWKEIQPKYGSALIAWSDMLFKLPHIPQIPANMIFTTAVSQSKSDRFDGVVCSGSTVLSISPRSVPKHGPFLMTTGVYLLRDIREFVNTYRMLVDGDLWKWVLTTRTPGTVMEIPIESIFLNMISKGLPFQADVLDFYLDLGTDEEFRAYARRFL